LMARKAEMHKTRFGDCFSPQHVEQLNGLSKYF